MDFEPYLTVPITTVTAGDQFRSSRIFTNTQLAQECLKERKGDILIWKWKKSGVSEECELMPSFNSAPSINC